MQLSNIKGGYILKLHYKQLSDFCESKEHKVLKNYYYNKVNLLTGKPLGEDRDLVALMGIRIFKNSDPIKK